MPGSRISVNGMVRPCSRLTGIECWEGAPKTNEHAMSQTLSTAIAVIGIDIGKNSFHVMGHDARGAIVLRQKWSRGQVEARLSSSFVRFTFLHGQGQSVPKWAARPMSVLPPIATEERTSREVRKVPKSEVAILPRIPHHALAGVARGDAGELALEGGGGGPAVQPFHFGGRGHEGSVGSLRGAIDDE